MKKLIRGGLCALVFLGVVGCSTTKIVHIRAKPRFRNEKIMVKSNPAGTFVKVQVKDKGNKGRGH